MIEAKTITQAQGRAAKKENLVEQFKPGVSVEVESARAGYFLEYVRRNLKAQFGLTDAQILRGGLTISTTLDLNMQDGCRERGARDPEPGGRPRGGAGRNGPAGRDQSDGRGPGRRKHRAVPWIQLRRRPGRNGRRAPGRIGLQAVRPGRLPVQRQVARVDLLRRVAERDHLRPMPEQGRNPMEGVELRGQRSSAT